ncbi:hypothetical protein HMPREF1015_01165 [Bacillus smithii 7_3_47FAA]|uniref:Uncharacterized protein n=1 Tax=Bacillus smithii 7_3_47FAA TaxID=665952 RepID=G9QHA6_9BACI|nr:hypothetical protein HMPREF1015_01165 [Bacillus smithii 7_3_47FAA]
MRFSVSYQNHHMLLAQAKACWIVITCRSILPNMLLFLNVDFFL